MKKLLAILLTLSLALALAVPAFAVEDEEPAGEPAVSAPAEEAEEQPVIISAPAEELRDRVIPKRCCLPKGRYKWATSCVSTLATHTVNWLNSRVKRQWLKATAYV